MKKTTLIALCLGIFICSCEKKSIVPSDSDKNSSYTENQISDLDLRPKPNENGFEKSITLPTFDFNHPVVSHDEPTDTDITTYFEAGSTDANNIWMMHEFRFEDHTTQMVYHCIKSGSTTKYEVYNSDGEYQFTFVNTNGTITVVQDNNPAEANGDFWSCMKWHLLYSYPEATIIVGTPYVTYWAYKCYQKYGYDS